MGHGGYVEGYSHEQTLLGHPLGGSGEALSGLVRIRPARWGVQLRLEGRLATWGTPGLTPGTGERRSLGLALGRTPRHPGVVRAEVASPPLLWEINVEWNREQADPAGHLVDSQPDSAAERDWWRLFFKVGI